MKKITFTIALVALAAVAAFASGSSEDRTMPWSQGQGQNQSGAVLSEETTTVTGKINLVEDGHVELVVGNETYELVYPYRLSYAADIQDGMEITVEGFEAEKLRMDNDPSTKNLVLKTVTIDGETYDLSEASDYFRRMGQRDYQMNGNRIAKNYSSRRNQQDAQMGQRGRNRNNQDGFTQNGSFGTGRR